MPPNAPQNLVRRMFALLAEARVTSKADRLDLYRWMVADPRVYSTNDLNEADIRMIADTLEHWKRNHELESRSHTAVDEARAKWSGGHAPSTQTT
jgi:hypothetical protein